ncbi:uncharacterized protein LOC131041630 isoform X3 [Cryptomeria japonica]|uniref:uncharacterized protein LOC131041630 isoform X3 n=1 Tax=Cryptomeria japonica TaxID=3369 RepID=UPI0025AB7E39|nr:uncharacterized protein LOC131041630 isoform X3 [Cryptomeria japonica]
MENGKRKGIENPFALKVGQVFTGFGVGCGIGIGVGRPLNLGIYKIICSIFKSIATRNYFSCSESRSYSTSIPMARNANDNNTNRAIPVIDQVMRATSGATVAFSGIGQHTNKFIRKIGLKSIEAGVGCGVGFGHGFGVGVALKPGAVNNIQACLMQGVTVIMKKLKIIPDLSFAGKIALPDSVGSSVREASETAGKAFQDQMGSGMQLASKSAEKVYQNPFGKSMHKASQTATGAFTANRSDTVMGNFPQVGAPHLMDKTGSNEEVGKLQSENQTLQMLLRHQEILEELKEENKIFRKILVEELNVSPDRLHKSKTGLQQEAKRMLSRMR